MVIQGVTIGRAGQARRGGKGRGEAPRTRPRSSGGHKRYFRRGDEAPEEAAFNSTFSQRNIYEEKGIIGGGDAEGPLR